MICRNRASDGIDIFILLERLETWRLLISLNFMRNPVSLILKDLLSTHVSRLVFLQFYLLKASLYSWFRPGSVDDLRRCWSRFHFWTVLGERVFAINSTYTYKPSKDMFNFFIRSRAVRLGWLSFIIQGLGHQQRRGSNVKYPQASATSSSKDFWTKSRSNSCRRY